MNAIQEHPPAGFMRRIGAMIYDFFLVFALWMITGFIAVAIAGDNVAGAAFGSLLFVEAFGFYTFFWIYEGQTLGMRAWNLRLISTQNPRITLREALLRFVVSLLSWIPLGLGHWWMLVDPYQRSWPDRLSNTRVIRDNTQ